MFFPVALVLKLKIISYSRRRLIYALCLRPMKHGPYVPHEFGVDAEAHYATSIGWLTASCSSSIPWPVEDVMVIYDGDDYFLRGVRDRGGHKNGPAITMRCDRSETNEVIAKVYRFASILGWYKRGYVDVGGYITGSHPTLYSEPQNSSTILAGGPHGFDCNYMPLIRDDLTRRALAFWREGSRLRYLHAGYAFLSFFKVLESQFEDTSRRVEWIKAAIEKLDGNAAKRVQELRLECNDVGKHIYESGRCAIAHAQFSDGRGDPDVPQDRARLAKDLVVIESLARSYIADVLQVPDEMVVYSTRDRLEPLSSVVPVAAFWALKAKEFVSRRHVGLNDLSVGIAHWPHPPEAELSRLTLRVTEVREGWVIVRAINDSGSISLAFDLDFPSGKAHINIEESSYRPPRAGEKPGDAIAVVRFRKQVIGNGQMELWLPDGGRMDFEVVIPINIDIGGTFHLMDLEIEKLEKLGSTDTSE